MRASSSAARRLARASSGGGGGGGGGGAGAGTRAGAARRAACACGGNSALRPSAAATATAAGAPFGASVPWGAPPGRPAAQLHGQPQRGMGMLSALQNALGLGDDSGTKAGEKKRADILAARSIQASAKLQRLLRRDRSAQEAWEYFAELCAGPDMNEFHCSIMLTATTSPEQVQEVVDMAGRVGVRPNAAVYTWAAPRNPPGSPTVALRLTLLPAVCMLAARCIVRTCGWMSCQARCRSYSEGALKGWWTGRCSAVSQ